MIEQPVLESTPPSTPEPLSVRAIEALTNLALVGAKLQFLDSEGKTVTVRQYCTEVLAGASPRTLGPKLVDPVVVEKSPYRDENGNPINQVGIVPKAVAFTPPSDEEEEQALTQLKEIQEGEEGFNPFAEP